MESGFRELLVGKPILVLRTDETITDASKELRALGESIAAVVDSFGKIKGVITPRDIIFRCIAEGKDPSKTRISEVMTHNPFCAEIYTKPEELPRILLKSGYSAIPLVMEGIPVGRILEREIRVQQSKAIEKLSSGTEEERLDAAYFLAGSGGAPAILALTQALRDSSPAVREIAVEGLLKEKSRMTVISLLPLLREENTVVRNCAIEILSSIGNVAIDKICEYADDPDEDVRIFVMNIIGNIGDPKGVDAVIKGLEDESPRVCQAAVVAAGDIKNKETVPYLENLLRNEDQWIRLSAAEALSKIGGTEAEKALLGAIDKSDDTLFLTLVDTLSSLWDISEHKVKELVNKVVERTKRMSIESASMAFMSLVEKYGPKILADVPVEMKRRTLETYVEELLKNGIEELKEEDLSLALSLEEKNIAKKLVKEAEMLPSDDPRVYILAEGLAKSCFKDLIIEILENNEPGRWIAINAALKTRDKKILEILKNNIREFYEHERVLILEQFPPDIEDAFDIGKMFLEEGSSLEKQYAAYLLGKIGRKDAIDLLYKFIKSESGDEDTEKACVEAISNSNFCNEAESCVFLDDPRPYIREAAFKTLRDSLPIEKVKDFLNDSNPEIVKIAIEELVKRTPENAIEHIKELIKTKNPEIIPLVLEIIEAYSLNGIIEEIIDYINHSDDDWTRFLAIQTLARVSGEEVIKHLKEWLHSGATMIEVASAQALKEIGTERALKVLLDLREHPNEEVRMLVSEIDGGM